MTDHASLLRQIRADARPYVEQALDLAEVFAGFRKLASDNGLDWGVIKALVKAEIQDEREGGTDKVERIIEKADFASAYADMLGLGSAKMNENNFSSTIPILQAKLPPHDSETGEITESIEPSSNGEAYSAAASQGQAAHAGTGSETLASHEGTSQGEGASVLSPINSQSAGEHATADAAAGSDPRPDASLPPRTSSDAQHEAMIKTTSPMPEAESPASSQEPCTHGSGAVHGRCEPTAPPDPGEIPAFLDRRSKAA